MKHTEAKAFVRKYNAEMSIRGYSKMKKADLERIIDEKVSRSREELQREWSALKAGPKPMAVKSGPKAKQMGVKSGAKRPPSASAARSGAAQARARAGGGMKKPGAKKPAAKKKPTAATKRAAENRVDDSWHSRNKDTSGQAQANRINSVVSRVERRAAVQRDTARVRRMRASNSRLRNYAP
jgi:hypothetical protein